MTSRDEYVKILVSIDPMQWQRLSFDSKNNIEKALDILEIILKESQADDAALQQECDIILVGALIATMVDTDAKYGYEYGTSDSKDFLYPLDSNEVYKDSYNKNLKGLETFKYGFETIGRRALLTKELPFTGSFNPAAFPGLDKLFGKDHFAKYQLNTDPETMVHPKTREKAKNKIANQQRLSAELDLYDLNAAMNANNNTDTNPFYNLLTEIDTVTQSFQDKLEKRVAKRDDLIKFQKDFAAIMTKPEHMQTMDTHRGSCLWRNIMNLLAKLEQWVRQLPTVLGCSPFSLAPKNAFFSTKVAKEAEKICTKVMDMRW